MRRTYSYSKRQSMETCTLKYFFEYYAAAVGTPFDAARKPLVQACKAMSSVAAEGGKIVHSMIRIFLAIGNAIAIRVGVIRISRK